MIKKNKNIKATELNIKMPFGIGDIKFVENDLAKKTAWKLYVEISTRISLVPLNNDEGILREALDSLYSLFNITRDILKDADPSIAMGELSLGFLAIEILNKGLRPFISKWHLLLSLYEESKPANISKIEYEKLWEKNKLFRKELEELTQEMVLYTDSLAKIATISS